MIVSDRWGIDEGYENALGEWRPTNPSTRAAILDAMRIASPAPDGDDDVRVIVQGTPLAISEPAEIILEDAATVSIDGALPPDVPTGYHDLRLLRSGRSIRLIVSPGRCRPAPRGAWGWAVQLY